MLDEDSDDDFEGYYDETDDCEGNQELNNGDVAHEICNIDNITADATTINSSSIYSSDVGEPTPYSSTGPSLLSMSSSSSISSATPVSAYASSGMSSTHSIPDSIGRSGSIADMSDKSPLDFFKLLVPNDILELVVDQTSLFAQQSFFR